MTTISQNTLKLIKNLLVVLALFSTMTWGKESFSMKNPYGESISLALATTRKEHTKGLSGLKSSQFKKTQGMLFVNSEMGPRRFWMPDTYFNLDIIFLDSDLRIIGLEKNVPAHPGTKGPLTIYRTETYKAQFILETKAGAPFGQKLKITDKLVFTGTTSLSEIVLRTRQKQ